MPSFGGGIRPARKLLPCVWCPESIEKGEEHNWWTWMDDGTVWTLRCHSECDRPLRESATMDIDLFFCDGEGPHKRGEKCIHND